MEIPSGKKKLISANRISMIFLIVGILAMLSITILNGTSSDASKKIDNLIYLMLAIGILLAGILISIISLVKLLERVG